MTSVAVFRGVSPPIHETLPRTERRAVAEWFAAGCVIYLERRRLFPARGQ